MTTGPELHGLGRGLVLIGLILAGCGLVLMAAPKVPWIGRLPGDVLIQRGHFTLYVPLTSCLLASLVLTLILWFIGRLR